MLVYQKHNQKTNHPTETNRNHHGQKTATIHFEHYKSYAIFAFYPKCNQASQKSDKYFY